ncbi:GNAT family N-acetyltransferase [Macrococcoides caseolyticum]|uniref:GNAT family N-acetyltransferase n=1 Tax=Macrococcoides caseolyticum TaxID=69966 RepID=UPI001F472EAF|nr:GNAT family N-acetyltransferase [Macrococcus caseolyticus]MCE4955922.1 GNAT family N-acetyltransferase [Macrococcus caseolyticus]
MREISIKETVLLKTIAEIHENIPKSYRPEYKVTQLDIALRYESIKLLMAHKHDRIIVIEDGHQLCAFIWIHLADAMHIKSTYVAPSYRQHGYATQLKRYVESIARAHHIYAIYSDVDDNNRAMISLNEKLGYHRVKNSKRMIKTIEV